MVNKSFWIFFLLIFFLSACKEVKSTRYRDTTGLEQPPEMEIVEPAKVEPQRNEQENLTGLGDVVSLSTEDGEAVILVKKIFDRSWDMVGQTLELIQVEVTDKNREQGVYYVNFDADQQSSKDKGLMEKTFFLFEDDDYEEAAYKLFVKWNENNTEVSTELVEKVEDDFLDEKGDFDSKEDGGEKLIHLLYKTMRDDLPID